MKKKTIIDVDFPGAALALNAKEGFIGKLHYIKKSQKEMFFPLIEQSDFLVYKVREETRAPWLAIHFKSREEVNLFKLMFGPKMLHQVYVINLADQPLGTVISVNPFKMKVD
jgi:hypothetical protein